MIHQLEVDKSLGAMSDRIQACRIDIRGVVQGIGFRPFVYRIAHQHAIKGWVRNDTRGVTIHAEASRASLDAFVVALRDQSPAGASIASLATADADLLRLDNFKILASKADQTPTARISPDLPTCEACLAELFDRESPRYLYPYINCTACGPRYSIIRSLPYDRPNTTMEPWQLCDACRAEYEDPANRRHHAQPTACNECGPNYRLVISGQPMHRGADAISHTASLLCRGQIVAIKGIGGYHLACAAADTDAVERLRTRKFRKEKPFALMVRDLAEASGIVALSDAHIDRLTDPARPIVLAPSKVQLPGIAADTDEFGIMLPYSPVHALLFHFGSPSPLVLTSANRSSEPIAFEDDDAVERLGAIADAFLIGERPIARRVDDSVVAIRNGQPAVVRRARGYTPAVVAHVPCQRPILALGADLKNSIALVVEGDVIMSQHIGDLGDLETDRSLVRTVDDLLAMYGIRADEMIVAHDLHPEFVSTRIAKGLGCHRRVAVQHHHAHIASVLAEHGDFDQPVVGIALDGTGYGEDGRIWGFEVFVGSVARGMKRVRHLRDAPLPGGDAAARHPVQAAAGLLAGLSTPDLRDHPFSFPQRYDDAKQLVKNNFRCFQTTSAGRLFDTVAALCGFTREVTYEGQAASWLEHQAAAIESDANSIVPYPFPDLDHRPLLQYVIDDRLAGRPIGEISFAFHAAMASSLSRTAKEVAGQHATNQMVVSGGVFQNRLLRELLTGQFHPRSGIQIRFNQRVPSNDGGISLGQAAIAGVTQS